MATVAINGFGRIGRLVLRAYMMRKAQDGPKIIMINDPFMTAKQMAYLFRYDSTHGRYKGKICASDKDFTVDGQKIRATSQMDVKKLDWKKEGVKYVIDATGKFTSCEKASKYLEGGAKRVILTSPSKDVPMFVVGVNHECYNPEMEIVSCASCTTNCLAPLCKVVHENFGIVEGLMTTIHASTPSQAVLDKGTKKWRSGRASLNNIIPASTGAAAAISKIIPDLEGKLTGMAFRVPTPDVSVVDLTAKLCKEAPMDMIKCKVKEASETYLKNILGYTEDDIVSQDILGDTRSSIFDAKAGLQLTKTFVKLISWYDNECGYSNRVVDLMFYVNCKESSC